MNKKTENKILEIIVEAAKKLKWNVAVPNLEDDQELKGLIMGTEEYIEGVTEGKSPFKVNCLICDKNLIDDGSGNVPKGIKIADTATFGSKFDGENIEVYICDTCIKKRKLVK